MTTLVLVSAGYAEDDVVIARHECVIRAAEEHGVAHVVYTSLTGAGDHLGFALARRWTERRLRRSALAWTVLRNGLYVEPFGALAAPEDAVVRAPFGDGALAAVAREDLADVAASVAAGPPAHAGRTYELVGITSVGAASVASALGVDYAPVPLVQRRVELGAAGLLPFQPAMLLSIFSAVAAGFLAGAEGDLARLLPSPPRNPLAFAVAGAPVSPGAPPRTPARASGDRCRPGARSRPRPRGRPRRAGRTRRRPSRRAGRRPRGGGR